MLDSLTLFLNLNHRFFKGELNAKLGLSFTHSIRLEEVNVSPKIVCPCLLMCLVLRDHNLYENELPEGFQQHILVVSTIKILARFQVFQKKYMFLKIGLGNTKFHIGF